MDFNLNHLRSFIIVARTGNLSAAAKELGTTQPNLGRQMTALEKEVNLILFVRHSRGLALTKHGQDFLNLCQEVVGRLAQGTDVIREKDSEPEGMFKFTSGIGLLETVLENIALFSDKYPKISFSFSSIINIYQLQIGDADASVGLYSQSTADSNFIARHLYDTSMRVYASPEYLAKNSTPKTFADLQHHKVLIFGGNEFEIMNQQIMKHTSPLVITPFVEVFTGPGMRTLLLSGAGIGCYGYHKELIEKGLLIDVFPDLPNSIVSYYYSYHKRLEGSPKINAFYEFLKEITKIWEHPKE
ncbi:MAG: LysR family transcriptional regulator [Alphaproteobacteria bacterium]|nr:LysR family transcriptional regulator [Alphaproteobacteria bacterium]